MWAHHIRNVSPERRLWFDALLRGVLQVVSRGPDTSVVAATAPVYQLRPASSNSTGRTWWLTGPVGAEYSGVSTNPDKTPPSTGKPIGLGEHAVFVCATTSGGDSCEIHLGLEIINQSKACVLKS